MIRLVVLDLDGTIFDPAGRPRISLRVVQAVGAVQQRGVGVTLATGRTLEYSRELARELGLSLPMVAAGGAVVGYPLTGATLYQAPIEPFAEVLDWFARTEREVCLYLRGPQGLRLLQNRAPRADSYYEQLFGGPRQLTRQATLEPGEVLLKFIIVSPDELPAGEIEVVPLVRTHPDLIEGAAPGVDKGTGLEVLLGHLGTAGSEVLAVGDNDNDLPLFARVGLAVAMGHATERVRAAASWVAPPFEEDGAAVALERFLISRNF
ncbi:HAD family phosphatase [bacterium CPR1]|nr:HAD family phosphatase [bacterium CPR1]